MAEAGRGRGRGTLTPGQAAAAGAPAGGGRGGGMAAPPGGADRKTTVVNRKPLETGERLSIYGMDLDNMKFDMDSKRNARGTVNAARDETLTSMWQIKGGGGQPVETVDGAAMFGNFDINVNSTAKAGTELGFEFKGDTCAILDNDYKNFSADDFDVEINASSIVLSGVSQCWQCNKSIMNPADGVTAFGKAYHRNHLQCSVTGRDFSDGGDAFEGEDGKVYSQLEWEKKYQKVCHTCNKPIKEKKPVAAKDKFYHRKCFTCQVCKEVLEGRWMEEDGRPICEKDYYRKRGLVCPCCNLHVDGEGKTVGKFKFHQRCYLCAYCRREPEGFFKQVPLKAGIYCGQCCSRIFPDMASTTIR